MIAVQNLTKNYGAKKALENVSFHVSAGEVVGLIGKNGAGKSTVLKSIAGLLHFDAGQILYNGRDCAQEPGLIRDFGILIECAFLDYVSAYANLKLLYCADQRNDINSSCQIISDAFHLVGLNDVKFKKVRTYSFGMKQRLGLAQAIINAKSFIMLDEPFIGLDPLGKEIVKKAILKKAQQDGYAVLFSSHDLEDVAEICDRIIMIEDGKCVYNGSVQKTRVTYTVTITDVKEKTRLADELAAIIPGVKFSCGSLTFVDDYAASILQEALQCILRYCRILKIETSGNDLKEMFYRGEIKS